ncbi:copper chaperone PCu(A)C [Maritimibacter sp. DP1N21-5]|uniref:copper chaperone PCu(A)C n=1 Tax=Maritimibacter sp. DP1N21-5 TaxID=2836867 RepID=UPI001C464872|nr:copper chaperone PCu(A)C [Maritimibacter sp. DP1N21-5]MBV7408603.1 copper chaperone PCu(A)C [Maritimibacter sp. DP1N21-5]
MKRTLLAAAAASLALSAAVLPARADSIIAIEDAYARAAGMNAMAGAAFFVISNTGDTDDRLIGAKSDVSERVELHTHIADSEGVMKMVEVEEGFPVAAGSTHVLQRGGDHVMFMGLRDGFENGETVAVTLVFEQAGEVVVEIPVDNDRKPDEMGGGMMNHGGHGGMNQGGMNKPAGN